MLRFKSIITRIICLHVIAVVITSIFMPLALYWLLNSATKNLHDSAMRDQATSIAHYLAMRPDGKLALDLPPGFRELYSDAYGRYAYAVLDESGHVLLSSHKQDLPVFSADTLPADVEFLHAQRGDKELSGATVPVEIYGRTFWVQVGEDLAHRDVLTDDIVGDFFKRVGWIILPILLLLLAADILIFRRALRPLLQASEQAQNISPTRIDIRLPVDEIPEEIRPLVLAVNQALERLEHGFRVQREFNADAAHELRTPLAVLRTRIDTLADQSIAKSLRQDVEGMSRVVSQLLDIAELDTFAVDPSEKADLYGICTAVAEFVAPLALAQEKNIALNNASSPIWVKGNSEMLSRAVRNLAENAINHTPRGTTVEFVVERSGTVSVLDHGPGIKDSERQHLFRRFWRRDRRRVGSAGLGLAIVRRIVEAHGASIRVENRPTGGAQFSLQLAPAD